MGRRGGTSIPRFWGCRVSADHQYDPRDLLMRSRKYGFERGVEDDPMKDNFPGGPP